MTGWHKTTSAQRGYGHKWRKLRARILNRDGHLCVLCRAEGKATMATTVDHIVPKAKDGTDDEGNLRSLCDEHHKAKTAEDSGRPLSPRVGADGWPVSEG